MERRNFLQQLGLVSAGVGAIGSFYYTRESVSTTRAVERAKKRALQFVNMPNLAQRRLPISGSATLSYTPDFTDAVIETPAYTIAKLYAQETNMNSIVERADRFVMAQDMLPYTLLAAYAAINMLSDSIPTIREEQSLAAKKQVVGVDPILDQQVALYSWATRLGTDKQILASKREIEPFAQGFISPNGGDNYRLHALRCGERALYSVACALGTDAQVSAALDRASTHFPPQTNGGKEKELAFYTGARLALLPLAER